jgi:hypothetical protein
MIVGTTYHGSTTIRGIPPGTVGQLRIDVKADGVE